MAKTTAKKPVAKKTTTKKVVPKKAPAKKAVTKKPLAKKTPVKKAVAKKTVKRPDLNLPPSVATVNEITDEILQLVTTLDDYAANLRAMDRMRHNGVGLKRLGFIEATLRIATKFPQYYPHWLDTPKFQRDLDLFNAVRSLVEVCRSLEEKAWNINIEASDMVYTDALEYYSQVQDAARRRVDAAESLYKELHGFFRHRPVETDCPTIKRTKRDVNALLKGKKDGEVIIRNIRPKTTGGTHEVIDETFKDKISYKETDKGSITE